MEIKKIKFLKDTFLDIVVGEEETEDGVIQAIIDKSPFGAGDEFEVEIKARKDDRVDLVFEYGDTAYFVDKSLFIIV